jgi:hypothetical protein
VARLTPSAKPLTATWRRRESFILVSLTRGRKLTWACWEQRIQWGSLRQPRVHTDSRYWLFWLRCENLSLWPSNRGSWDKTSPLAFGRNVCQRWNSGSSNLKKAVNLQPRSPWFFQGFWAVSLIYFPCIYIWVFPNSEQK